MTAVFISWLAILALILWIGIILLPWKPWSTREIFEEMVGKPTHKTGIQTGLQEITVIIPARNEASIIQNTLKALKNQLPNSEQAPLSFHVIVVDDCSEDDTADQARKFSGLNLSVIEGKPLPDGWAGKLWALEQGVRYANTPYILFLDADIYLEPGVIEGLLQIAQSHSRALVSVMAELPVHTFWERLLIPLFVYFFKMLYPFPLANSSDRRFASAAGGCMLIERQALNAIGGLESIRGAIIDDCTLARRLKKEGLRTWVGLSRMVRSQRKYHRLSDIWNMVARSAYTQLRYSPLLLLLTTIGLATLFWSPLLGILSGFNVAQLAGIFALLIMFFSYTPTLRFYRLSLLWAFLLPVGATLYLAMTWTSAARYWRGSRSVWKNRIYSS